MAFTATQYLFKATVPTSTTTATVGAYTVPAATRFQIIGCTISNTATTNLTTYTDVSLFDGTNTYPMLVKAPLYPGGCLILEGVQKHLLPTSGALYVTAYSTNVSVIMTGIEVT